MDQRQSEGALNWLILKDGTALFAYRSDAQWMQRNHIWVACN
jgi:hypothetical protein